MRVRLGPANFSLAAASKVATSTCTLVAQPIVPRKIYNDWNLIDRKLIPFSDVQRIAPNRETGLGSTVQSFFVAPSTLTASGITSCVLLSDANEPLRRSAGNGKPAPLSSQ